MAFVTVKGKIARTFFNGKGAEVVESFTVSGREVSKRWTAWFDQPHGLVEGAEVEVSGLHGDELNSWEKDGETRHSVKRSINKARLKGEPQPAPVEEPWATSQAQGDDWPTATVPEDSEVPF